MFGLENMNIPTNPAEFEAYIEDIKRQNHIRRFSKPRSLDTTVEQSLLDAYHSAEEYFCCEMTGYWDDGSTVYGITFYATDDKKYSLPEAIKVAQKLYEKRTKYFAQFV